MKVLVEIAFCYSKVFPLQVEENYTVLKVKEMVEPLYGFPISDHYIVFLRKLLENELTLGACGVGEDATLYIILRFKAC